MTRSEQRKFIRDITKGIRERMLKNLPRTPENWGGHELCAWCVAIVNEDVNYTKMDSARRADFENELIVSNL